MSNQVKSIGIAAFKVSATVLLFLGKVIVYVAIAFAVVGQLLFAEYAQSCTTSTDPWEEVAPIATVAKTIARPAVLALDVPDVLKETIALDVDACRYQSMTSPQLRQECGKVGIQWRNAHGRSKHLSKAEMLAALAA